MKTVREWLWLALFAVGAILGYLALERRKDPIGDIKREKKAIQAAQKTRVEVATVGHAEALASIEVEHQEALAALSKAQNVEASKLAEDPGALAAFLVRAAG